MAGYVYGGTVSEPKLNGYAGDGAVSWLYRAEGGTDWKEWKNIAADALVPGNYEIKASVAEATNYTGGETQPAAFSVSHAELGVSISMADYTYGGTAPTPRLRPRRAA